MIYDDPAQIGDTVLFHGYNSQWSSEQDYAAVITWVGNLGQVETVNLTWFDPHGGTHGEIGVVRGPDRGQWSRRPGNK